MADEVSIRINGVLYVRNPYSTGSVTSLLVRKGVELEKALYIEEQCRLTEKGRKIRANLPGIEITA